MDIANNSSNMHGYHYNIDNSKLFSQFTTKRVKKQYTSKPQSRE